MNNSEKYNQKQKEENISPAMRDFLRVAADSDAPDEIILTQEELRLKKMVEEASVPKTKSKDADGPARFIGGKDSNDTGLER